MKYMSIIFCLFFFSAKGQEKGKWKYDELEYSVTRKNDFIEYILFEKGFKHYDFENGDYFADGSNSVKWISNNKSLFFFSDLTNFENVIKTIKSKCQKRSFQLEKTIKGEYYVSTYSSTNIIYKFFKGYSNNLHIIVELK